MSDTDIINIIIMGRGGMGAVTACELIAEAAYLSGNFVDVHAYPSFGAERRGAPIQAFAKLSKKTKIWDRSYIDNPDIIIVLDESVLNQTMASSLKENGILIINTDKEPDIFRDKFSLSRSIHLIVADINKLAFEKNLVIDGMPVVNTAILGLLSRSIEELHLENLYKVVENRMDENIAKLNIELIEEGYKLAKIL